MNLTGELQPVNLTTSARVISKLDTSQSGESRTALIDGLIEEVSAEFCHFLGVHLLLAERTEVYELRKHSKLVTLDARNVTPGITVKIASLPADLSSSTAQVEGDDYTLNAVTGTIRFRGWQIWSPAYVEVTYTGGYFTEGSPDIGMRHKWLTNAADLQVLYRLQRQDTLGGNLDTSGGQGTNFTQGEYDFLPRVLAALQLYQRGTV